MRKSWRTFSQTNADFSLIIKRQKLQHHVKQWAIFWFFCRFTKNCAKIYVSSKIFVSPKFLRNKCKTAFRHSLFYWIILRIFCAKTESFVHLKPKTDPRILRGSQVSVPRLTLRTCPTRFRSWFLPSSMNRFPPPPPYPVQKCCLWSPAMGLGSGAGIYKQSMGARNRVGIGYRPARLHRLAEFIPWKLESIPGLYKRLKIRARL